MKTEAQTQYENAMRSMNALCEARHHLFEVTEIEKAKGAFNSEIATAARKAVFLREEEKIAVYEAWVDFSEK